MAVKTSSIKNKVVGTLKDMALDFVPAGLKALCKAGITEFTNRRDRAYFEKIREGDVPLDKAMLNDDQVHAFLCTLDGALRAETEEKAGRFASLFVAYQKGQITNLSEVAETASLLADLSEREWIVLLILRKHMGGDSEESEESEEEVGVRWAKAEREIISTVGLGAKQLPPFLNRLGRTGLVRVMNVAGVESMPEHTTFLNSRFDEILSNLNLGT